MASLGHSGSQAPQLMQSDVMYVVMAGSRGTSGESRVQPREHSVRCQTEGCHLGLARGAWRKLPSGALGRLLSLAVAPMNRFPLLALLAVPAALALGLGLSGCTPKIGDHCAQNTDCSLQGTIVCDTSAPDGYCTVFNCIPDSCLDKAACVEFGGNVP